MNIYTVLKQDHRNVEALLEEILNTTNSAKCERLFVELKQEILVHAEAEDQTFYAALQAYDEVEIEHAREEHEEVKELLHELSDMEVDDEYWEDTLLELRQALLDHIDEEENEIFDEAKEVLSDEEARDLAFKMRSLKEKLQDQKLAA